MIRLAQPVYGVLSLAPGAGIVIAIDPRRFAIEGRSGDGQPVAIAGADGEPREALVRRAQAQGLHVANA